MYHLSFRIELQGVFCIETLKNYHYDPVDHLIHFISSFMIDSTQYSVAYLIAPKQSTNLQDN